MNRILSLYLCNLLLYKGKAQIQLQIIHFRNYRKMGNPGLEMLTFRKKAGGKSLLFSLRAAVIQFIGSF